MSQKKRGKFNKEHIVAESQVKLTPPKQCQSALRWPRRSSWYPPPQFCQSTSSHSQRAWCCLQWSQRWRKCVSTSNGCSASRLPYLPLRHISFPFVKNQEQNLIVFLSLYLSNPAVGAKGLFLGVEAVPGSRLPFPIKPSLVHICPVLVVIRYNDEVSCFVWFGVGGVCSCKAQVFFGLSKEHGEIIGGFLGSQAT